MFSNGFFLFIATLVVAPMSMHSLYAQNAQSGVPTTSATTPAQITTTEVSDIFLLCKRDKSVRWLRAYKLENGKCKTLYSKEGYLQVISSATYFASCEGVLQSVQKNIEEGGFKCNPAQQVSVIDLDN